MPLPAAEDAVRIVLVSHPSTETVHVLFTCGRECCGPNLSGGDSVKSDWVPSDSRVSLREAVKQACGSDPTVRDHAWEPRACGGHK